jgi:hypothetical protein
MVDAKAAFILCDEAGFLEPAQMVEVTRTFMPASLPISA